MQCELSQLQGPMHLPNDFELLTFSGGVSPNESAIVARAFTVSERCQQVSLTQTGK